MNIKNRYKQIGFTLIELLVALTIITILAVAVYAALNPAQRLADSKNARRQADMAEILSAIHQAVIDNKGSYPTLLTAGSKKQLGTGNLTDCPATVGALVATQCTGVTTVCSNLLADDTVDLIPYLASLPIDPGGTATAAKTGYVVSRGTGETAGIVTVQACHAESLTSPLTVSR